jgi:hypothetical protein
MAHEIAGYLILSGIGGGVSTIVAAEDIVIELELATEAEVVEIIDAEVETQETTAEVVQIIDAEVDQ